MTLRERAVKIMQDWVGLNRADQSHMEIINLYNTQEPLPRSYPVKFWDDFCATTTSAVSVKLGIRDIAPTECSVGQLVRLYEAIGRWVEDDGYRPKPGDLICCDWQDPGTGDDVGWPDHVGMVESVEGNTIHTIEGNMAGGVVGRNTVTVGQQYIRGYCCPDYESRDSSFDPIQAEIDALPEWSRPTIQKLYDNGSLRGDGESLGLTHDFTRTLVVLDRVGMFDK